MEPISPGWKLMGGTWFIPFFSCDLLQKPRRRTMWSPLPGMALTFGQSICLSDQAIRLEVGSVHLDYSFLSWRHLGGRSIRTRTAKIWVESLADLGYLQPLWHTLAIKSSKSLRQVTWKRETVSSLHLSGAGPEFASLALKNRVRMAGWWFKNCVDLNGFSQSIEGGYWFCSCSIFTVGGTSWNFE